MIFWDWKIEGKNYKLNDQIAIETLIKKSLRFELLFILVFHKNSTKSLLIFYDTKQNSKNEDDNFNPLKYLLKKK